MCLKPCAEWNSWKQVLYVGLPAAGTNILVPVSTGIITGMVAAYGPEAVAALGVGSRIESVGMGVVWALGRYIALLFNDDATVVATLADYLRIVPLGYGLLGVLMLVNATLNALNRPFQSALLTLLRLFVLYVPLAFAGSTLFGLRGILGAAALANVLAGIAAYLWLRRILAGDRLNPRRSASTGASEEAAVAGD